MIKFGACFNSYIRSELGHDYWTLIESYFFPMTVNKPDQKKLIYSSSRIMDRMRQINKRIRKRERERNLGSSNEEVLFLLSETCNNSHSVTKSRKAPDSRQTSNCVLFFIKTLGMKESINNVLWRRTVMYNKVVRAFYYLHYFITWRVCIKS